jgi:hypothetical protein
MATVDIEISVSDVQLISIPADTASELILPSSGWFAGFSLRETTGAAVATVRFTSGNNIVAVVQLAAGASANQWFGDHGFYVGQDVTMNVLAGSVEGAVYAAWAKPL